MDNTGFFNMQYQLSDLLMIIGYIGGLIATYVIMTSRITRIEVRIETLIEKYTLVRADVEKNKESIDKEKRYVVEKLAQIEAGQAKTNVFLEENLKNLTRIITVHETELRDLKSKLHDSDKVLTSYLRGEKQ